MNNFDINKYSLLNKIEEKEKINDFIVLENEYLCVCTIKAINIYYIHTYEKYMKINENINDQCLSYLIYTKNKYLICQSKKGIEIYSINLVKKSYNLFQTINILNLFWKPIELSNGNIVTSLNSKIIILQNIRNKSNNNILEIQSVIKFGQKQIECIIETTNNEICGSSTYDGLIGFWNKKTLKLNSIIKYRVFCGSGALCMINQQIMLVINVNYQEYAFINIINHQVIKAFIKKDIDFCYALNISNGKILLACQDEWKKLVTNQGSKNGYSFIPYKEPTYINILYCLFDEEKLVLNSLGMIKTSHVEPLNNLIMLNNKNIISCCSDGHKLLCPSKASIQIWGY